jgi:hypothetical protein
LFVVVVGAILVWWLRSVKPSPGSFAMFAAILLASSLLSNFAADLRPGSSSK